MWFLIKQWLVYTFGSMFGFLEYLDKIMVFWTFLAIGLSSGGFLFLTMMLGEISEFFGDMFGGDADHDFSADGDHDAGHADGGHDDLSDTGEFSTPSLFSFRILLSFFSGFGITGAVATRLNQPVLTASLYGLGAGAVMMLLTYAFVMFLASAQASVNITDADLIGKEAEVIIEIPPDGMGQVEIATNVGSITKLCRADTNEFIPQRSIVKVDRVLGNLVIVKRT